MGADEGDIVPAGTVLGRYRVVRTIGAGGMGAVYEAVHTGLNKRVAIKVLHPTVARDAGIRARFVQEGEIAARIRHPHVVDVHDVATDGGFSYLVMDYLEGEDLSALIKREGPLDPPRIAELLLPVFDAIQAAHDVGVVHRDLKPANVFLARSHGDISPQVLDFGISKIIQDQTIGGDGLTKTGMVMGTPNYMSPEQVMGTKDLDGRADVYALGAIMYECVTGKRAFDGMSMVETLIKIASGKLDPPRKIRPSISEAFEKVVLLAMHPDRDTRFASARDLSRAVLPFASPPVAARWFGTPAPPLPALPSTPPADKGPATTSDARPLTATLSRPTHYGPLIGLAAALVGAVIATAFLMTRAPKVESLVEAPPAAPMFTVTFDVTTPSAQITIDGKPVPNTGRISAEVPKDGKSHVLEIRAEGYAPQTIEFFEDVKPPASVRLVPLGNNQAPIVR